MNTLHMLGEAASICASAIICSVSWDASKRIVPDAMVPVVFARGGQPGLRLKKPFALLLMPVIGCGLLLTLSALPLAGPGTSAGMVFTLQLFAAIGFVAAHIIHIQHALTVLRAEGKLRT